MTKFNTVRTPCVRNEFRYSKELCLKILELREKKYRYSEIYDILELSKYYPNSLSSAIYRFYRDCEGYGIDTSHIYNKRFYIICEEQYKDLCEDLKNNPKKYTITQLLKKHGIPNKHKCRMYFYNDVNPYKVETTLYNLKDNLLYNHSESCRKFHAKNVLKTCVEVNKKRGFEKYNKMTIRLEDGESFADFYKEFGYKTPDSCRIVYKRLQEQYL